MAGFKDVAEILTKYPYYQTGAGRELAKILKKIIDPNRQTEAFRNIAAAIKFAHAVKVDRGLHDDRIVEADPLAITKVLSELRTSSNATVDEATICAAILYPVLRIKRPHQFASPDLSQMKEISGHLERIGGRDATKREDRIRGLFGSLSPEVEALVRNTLQISEINRGGGVTGPDQGERLNRSGNEDDASAAFVHMVEEVVKDPRAMRIRGAQWLVHMRTMGERMDSASATTAETQERLKDCISLTNEVYVPLASAYGDHGLRDKMNDQLDRMTRPEEYNRAWERIIDVAKNAAPAGKKAFVRDLPTANRIVIGDFAKEIQSLVPVEFRESHSIEGNIKSTVSTSQKILKKNGNADGINDIVRLRIIVKLPLSPNASDEEILRAEQTAVSRIFAAVDAEASKDQKFSLTDEEKDYRRKSEEERQRRHRPPGDDARVGNELEIFKARRQYKNYYKHPKANGYRAIHAVLIRNIAEDGYVRSAKFELQIVGEKTHLNNQDGSASHDGKYKFGNLPTAPDATKDYTVSVFTPNNHIVQLSRPATAVDFIAAYHGPDIAFSANAVYVKRNPANLFDKDVREPDLFPDMVPGYATTLNTGDTVFFATAPVLLNDASHRQDVINASQVIGTQDILKRRHRQLVSLSYSDMQARRPGENNPAGEHQRPAPK